MSNKIAKKEKFLSYYSILLVIVLLAAVNLNSSVLLYILIGGAALLLFNPVYILPVYIISSLSSDYFVAGEGLGISRIIGFVLILGGFIYQLQNNYSFRKKELFFLLLILSYAFISSVFSLTGSLKAFITLAQNIIIILLVSQFRGINLQHLSRLLIISAVLTILILALTLKENLITIQAQRLTTGENVNENRFAMMLAQLTAITFSGFFIFTRKKLHQTIILSIIILSYFMLVLNGSRSAIIGITVAILVIFFYLLKKQTRKFIIPFILLLIIGYFFINQIQLLDIPLIERFTIEKVKESGGTGRFEIWRKLVPVTLENSALFGYGLGGENSYALAYRNGLGHAAHNFLIDMFIQTGLVGAILFFSFFIYLGKKLKNSLSSPVVILPVMILLTALFNGIGEVIYLEKLFWNGIALGFLYINNSTNHVKSNNQIQHLINEPL